MKILSKLYTGFIFVFLYAPILVLIVFSFNDSKSRAVWGGFTLKWYGRLMQNTEILNALTNTLLIAVLTAVAATLLGTAAAIGINGMNKWMRRIAMNITNLPMANPEIVTGVSMLLLFVFLYDRVGILKPGFGTLLIAHITFCLPYVVLSVQPKLRQMDPNLYEAAQDLGCAPGKAFFKVVLPEIMPGIVTGIMMSFTISIDDFVISYFTSGTTETLPIAIYSMTRKLVSPEINALSTLLFGTVLLLLVMVNLRQIRDQKRMRVRKGGEGR